MKLNHLFKALALILFGLGANALSAQTLDYADSTHVRGLRGKSFFYELTSNPLFSLQGRVTVHQDDALLDKLGDPESKDNNLTVIDGIRYVKMNGYRIQAYSDNKSTAKSEAFRKESGVKSVMPGVATYVSYTAPFWRVRVGDFLCYEDAYEALLTFQRKLDYGREMSIVRETIFVPLR